MFHGVEMHAPNQFSKTVRLMGKHKGDNLYFNMWTSIGTKTKWKKLEVLGEN
jgi:hypothetical protein